MMGTFSDSLIEGWCDTLDDHIDDPDAVDTIIAQVLGDPQLMSVLNPTREKETVVVVISRDLEQVPWERYGIDATTERDLTDSLLRRVESEIGADSRATGSKQEDDEDTESEPENAGEERYLDTTEITEGRTSTTDPGVHSLSESDWADLLHSNDAREETIIVLRELAATHPELVGAHVGDLETVLDERPDLVEPIAEVVDRLATTSPSSIPPSLLTALVEEGLESPVENESFVDNTDDE